MRLEAKDVFAFGDKPEDSVGANRASIPNAICTWGTVRQKYDFEIENYTYSVINFVPEILNCIGLK